MNKLYTWSFEKKSLKEFQKLDTFVQKRIVKWLNEHIEGSNNPRAWGKPLTGSYGDLWRYRVGNYRIISDIHDSEFVVIVVKTGVRGNIY